MRKEVAWSVALWSVLGAFCIGAPMKLALVAGNAGWVAHLDLESLKRTQIGSFIDREMHTPENERKLEAFKAVFAFDPRDDLKSITAYGPGAKERKGVVLIEGVFDTDRIVTLVRSNDEYREEKYRGDTIHTWVEKKAAPAPGAPAETAPVRKYGALLPGGLAIASEDEQELKAAVDVCRARKPALAPSSSLGAMIPSEPVPFFVVGRNVKASQPASPANGPTQNPAAADGMKTLVLKAGEKSGNFFCDAAMTTRDEQTAGQTQAAIQGLIAMLLLNQETDPKVAAFLRGVSCVGEGDKVRLTISYPAADMVQLLQEQKLKKAMSVKTKDASQEGGVQ